MEVLFGAADWPRRAEAQARKLNKKGGEGCNDLQAFSQKRGGGLAKIEREKGGKGGGTGLAFHRCAESYG